MQSTLKTALIFSLVTIVSVVQSCKPNPKIVKHGGEKDLISFKPVFGVNYTEISRRSENGLSFNEYGYQMEPQWRLSFVSNDSASIYSPTKGRFINFPLTRGYDSIFNTARSWFKVKAMNKDSLKLEMINAYGDTVDTRGTKTYMTFYADNYIKNTLHTDTTVLKRPSKKDSLFIRSLAQASIIDYTEAFAARQPAVLTSNSPLVKIKKWKAEGDLLNNFDTSGDYMNPTFDIAITKAYANFYYSFSVFIDFDGKMYYNRPLIPFFDQSFKDEYVHLSTTVMNSYLKHYLKILPGKTLNMPHASEISIHVQGRTGI